MNVNINFEIDDGIVRYLIIEKYPEDVFYEVSDNKHASIIHSLYLTNKKRMELSTYNLIEICTSNYDVLHHVRQDFNMSIYCLMLSLGYNSRQVYSSHRCNVPPS